MAYRVIPTDTFEAEFGAVIGYHLDVLRSEAAAKDLASKLDHVSELLAANPELKNISTKPSLKKASLRECYVKSYVLVYRIEGDTVYFEHFFHQSQNFESQLSR